MIIKTNILSIAAKKKFVAAMLFVALFTACDSGDIYPENKTLEEMNLRIDAVFDFRNGDAFPQNYRIVWGAFVGTSPYPLAFENVAKPDGKSAALYITESVPKSTTFMALALIEKNENKARFFFKQYPLNNASGEMKISETVDLATLERVQAQVFTPQCIQCHGGGGLAAGLDLTEGKAYENLVGKPSQPDNSPKNRVTKGSLQNSFLLDVLTDRPPTVTTNHTTLSTLDAADDINLIRAWILSTGDDAQNK